VVRTMRVKHLRLVPAPNGVRVELQTQDDLGYYDYAFDAMER
jgi:hypothetical protein